MINKSEIRQNLKRLSREEQKEAYGLLDKLDIDVSEGDKLLTGTKPSGFYLEGKFYAVEHHREIFLKIAEIAASKNPTKTGKFLEITGRKRKYFTRDYRELSFDYKRIGGTDIYAELNENARTLDKRAKAIMIKFGLDITSLKIT